MIFSNLTQVVLLLLCVYITFVRCDRCEEVDEDSQSVISDLTLADRETEANLVGFSFSPYEHDELFLASPDGTEYGSFLASRSSGQLQFFPFELQEAVIGATDTIRYHLLLPDDRGILRADVDTIDFEYQIKAIHCEGDVFEAVRLYYNGELQFEGERPNFVTLYK